MEVVYDYVDVAGLKYRLDDVLALIDAIDSGHAPSVRLEPEPDNIWDENAIKVVGACPDGERHIGYVPAPLADLIRYKKMRGLAAEIADYRAPEGDKPPVLQIRILAPS